MRRRWLWACAKPHAPPPQACVLVDACMEDGLAWQGRTRRLIVGPIVGRRHIFAPAGPGCVYRVLCPAAKACMLQHVLQALQEPHQLFLWSALPSPAFAATLLKPIPGLPLSISGKGYPESSSCEYRKLPQMIPMLGLPGVSCAHSLCLSGSTFTSLFHSSLACSLPLSPAVSQPLFQSLSHVAHITTYIKILA